MQIYKAYYESRNFDFEAYSQEKQKAIDLVIEGLKKHTKQYNLASDWWSIDGIECYFFITDVPYRDRDEI